MNSLSAQELDRGVQYNNLLTALRNSGSQAVIRKSGLKASQMMSVINSYNFINGYKKENKVAFVGEQFPSEILHAFGIVSFNLESVAGVLARSNNLDHFFKAGEEKNLSRDICSVIRSEFGLGVANCYPVPEFMITATHPCDGYTKIIFNLAKLYNKKAFTIDVPSVITDEVISYVEEQIKMIVQGIETELNVKLDTETFNEVIRNSNEARRYYFDAFDLCEKTTLPDITHELMAISMVGLWGKQEITSVCKTLYNEALDLYRKNKDKGTKKRVIWYGQMAFYSDELIQYLEKQTEIIYFAPLLNYREMIDPENPYRSLAKRYVQYAWNPEVLRGAIGQFANKLKIDGIILQNAWGCRNLIGLNSMLRDIAKEMGLRILMLDNDYLDKEKVAFSHVKNRIDAFLEIL